MNPFNEKPIDFWNTFENWDNIYPKPYNKYEVDPYTKTRIILMNGQNLRQTGSHINLLDIVTTMIFVENLHLPVVLKNNNK